MPPEKMHANEIDIDVGLARRLIAEQFPEWAELAVDPVTPWGTDNAIFRLGGDMALRLPRIPRTSKTLELERQWLPWLAPRLPFATPRPLANGTPTAEYPFSWSVFTWLVGDNATPEHIADEAQLADDLARLLIALRRLDPTGGPRPGEVNAFRGEPLARRDRRTRDAIAALSDEIDVDEATAAWDEALAAHAWTGPPVWLHGDLDSRNLLAENGRLSAVIDFGTLSVGDPACDVAVAWKMLTAQTRERLRAALRLDDGTWARGRGWVLSQALIALPYYTLETNAVLVREAQRWLAEVLADYRH